MLPLPGIHLLTRSRYDTLAAVAELQIPLLVIHGTDDELVPLEMGKRVYEAASAPNKTFRGVRGGHHNDTYYVAGPQYYRWLKEFFRGLQPVQE